MAWESALDRLILQQVHLAEKGEARKQAVEEQILDLYQLQPDRHNTAFHLGYARALLGSDLPEPKRGDAGGRWYTFGRLRGHDRRGERNWVVDLIQDQAALMELLSDARIAAACLPLVMRSLFYSGDLGLALKAIRYLSSGCSGHEADLFIDAALTDLLSRLESRLRDAVREPDLENAGLPVGELLQQCLELPAFEHLPADVRARYYRAHGQVMLLQGDFDQALSQLELAFELSTNQPRLASSVAGLRALAGLRLHGLEELRPQAERHHRDDGVVWFDRGLQDGAHSVPEAWFGRGVLAYEVGDFGEAETCLDACLKSSRRANGRDEGLLNRSRFYLAASLLSAGSRGDSARALRLMEQALETVQPDLEGFYTVHEELKKLDRKIALQFLDAVEVERGTTPDQLLIVALEYLGLGEAAPAADAAERVLQVAVDLDQRIEAMRVVLTSYNMRGDRDSARKVFEDMRDLLLQRGAFNELESLLQNEEFVGQALDHLDIKCELVALYEEMEDREIEKVTLQCAIARSLRARKDSEALQEAFGILKEVEVTFPDLARDDLAALEKLLAITDETPVNPNDGASMVRSLATQLGRAPRILVVGGNERQRRHHPRFEQLAKTWSFDGEWWMANYTSPQKLVNQISERLKSGIDVLILLHWNRHETTEPALELARKAGVPARTVHYAGFTSLQVSLTDMLGKLSRSQQPA